MQRVPREIYTTAGIKVEVNVELPNDGERFDFNSSEWVASIKKNTYPAVNPDNNPKARGHYQLLYGLAAPDEMPHDTIVSMLRERIARHPEA